jgi:hypothetical protein
MQQKSFIYSYLIVPYFSCRSKLNIAVLELREKGFLHKLEEKWWYSKGECGNADGSVKHALYRYNLNKLFVYHPLLLDAMSYIFLKVQ